jgi:hypothetical protein
MIGLVVVARVSIGPVLAGGRPRSARLPDACWSNRRGCGRYTRSVLSALTHLGEGQERYVLLRDRETARGSDLAETSSTPCIGGRWSSRQCSRLTSFIRSGCLRYSAGCRWPTCRPATAAWRGAPRERGGSTSSFTKTAMSRGSVAFAISTTCLPARPWASLILIGLGVLIVAAEFALARRIGVLAIAQESSIAVERMSIPYLLAACVLERALDFALIALLGGGLYALLCRFARSAGRVGPFAT